MILALVIAGIALMMLTFSIAYYKKDIIELAVLGISGFLCVYVVASGVLFGLNAFNMRTALIITLAVILVSVVVMYVLVKRPPSVKFNIKESLIPAAAFGVMLLAIFTQNEFFGMGQDQGVYQVKALALITGNTDNYFTFEEYDSLTFENDIESYNYEVAKSLIGFYGYDAKSAFLDKANYPSKMTGVLHGFPTYSAMLALFGTLFGYYNMTRLQTVLAFCGLFLMYYVMRNLKIRKRMRLAALLIYASSPIVLWTAKTTLTETFTMVLVMLYLYFMMDRNYPKYVWASFIPILTFSFFHITIYTIMPMLVLSYVTMYYMTRNKQYLIANMGALAGYLAGFFAMRSSAAVYTYGNYKKIFVLGINSGNLVWVVTAVVLLCMLATAVLIIVPVTKQENFREVVVGGIRRHMILVCRILLVLSLIALAVTFIHTNVSYKYSTFYAYIISSGIVVIPMLFAAFLYRPQFITANKDHLLLTIMFVYMVIMYSCIFKPVINNYYYYGRYIVPYIPIILILAALRVSRIDGRFEIWKNTLPIIAAVVYMAVMVPYNLTLATQKDITNMSWQIIQDLSQEFEEGDAVIIDSKLASSLKFPIKFLTNADTYPIAENMREQIARLESDHENVYYVTTTEWFLFKNYSIDNVYSCNNEVWQDDLQSDEGKKKTGMIPFAKSFVKTTQSINVYKCKSDF